MYICPCLYVSWLYGSCFHCVCTYVLWICVTFHGPFKGSPSGEGPQQAGSNTAIENFWRYINTYKYICLTYYIHVLYIMYE